MSTIWRPLNYSDYMKYSLALKLWYFAVVILVLATLVGVFFGVKALISSATENSKLDGLIVRDEQGTLYRLEHQAGGTYYIHPMGSNLTWKSELK